MVRRMPFGMGKKRFIWAVWVGIVYYLMLTGRLGNKDLSLYMTFLLVWPIPSLIAFKRDIVHKHHVLLSSIL